MSFRSLVLALFALVAGVVARTEISGVVTNATWTVAGSPYVIVDQAFIFYNNTVDVDDGVQLVFQWQSSSAEYPSLGVPGTLRFHGAVSIVGIGAPSSSSSSSSSSSRWVITTRQPNNSPYPPGARIDFDDARACTIHDGSISGTIGGVWIGHTLVNTEILPISGDSPTCCLSDLTLLASSSIECTGVNATLRRSTISQGSSAGLYIRGAEDDATSNSLVCHNTFEGGDHTRAPLDLRSYSAPSRRAHWRVMANEWKNFYAGKNAGNEKLLMAAPAFDTSTSTPRELRPSFTMRANTVTNASCSAAYSTPLFTFGDGAFKGWAPSAIDTTIEGNSIDITTLAPVSGAQRCPTFLVSFLFQPAQIPFDLANNWWGAGVTLDDIVATLSFYHSYDFTVSPLLASPPSLPTPDCSCPWCPDSASEARAAALRRLLARSRALSAVIA